MKPEPVVITPAYLPPATGEQCPRCGEDLLDHDRLGIVCRSGHAPKCDCAAHDVGPACPALATIKPADPLPADVLEQLDPGVRRLVAVLRANGFETIDSGDGVTPKDCETNPVPHVVMEVDPSQLVAEADRLEALVSSWGLANLNREPDGQGVDACYLPASKRAHLVLWGMTDAVLP